MSAAASLRRILAVVHPGTKDPGYYASVLARQGAEITFCCPAEGDGLPQDITPYAGVMMFGGPMSANDDTPWMRAEIGWVEKKILPAGVPFLGACLGAQILARAAGGVVSGHPEGRVEAGYYPLRATRAGRDWFPSRLHVYAFHEEGILPPPEAELLAQGGPDFPCQAFRLGRAFGFQFHGEASLAMRRVWLTRAARRLTRPGARRKLTHFTLWPLYEPRIARWRRRFFHRWLGTGHTPLAGGLYREVEG